MEKPDYKTIVMGIKSSCETTLRCNKRIMDREFKDYDGRYYDAEKVEYTRFETENTEAEIMLDYINKELKKMEESV
jgi:hypothetical protein